LTYKDPDFRDVLEGVFAEWRAALAERVGGTE